MRRRQGAAQPHPQHGIVGLQLDGRPQPAYRGLRIFVLLGQYGGTEKRPVPVGSSLGGSLNVAACDLEASEPIAQLAPIERRRWKSWHRELGRVERLGGRFPFL